MISSKEEEKVERSERKIKLIFSTPHYVNTIILFKLPYNSLNHSSNL